MAATGGRKSPFVKTGQCYEPVASPSTRWSTLLLGFVAKMNSCTLCPEVEASTWHSICWPKSTAHERLTPPGLSKASYFDHKLAPRKSLSADFTDSLVTPFERQFRMFGDGIEIGSKDHQSEVMLGTEQVPQDFEPHEPTEKRRCFTADLCSRTYSLRIAAGVSSYREGLLGGGAG
ncbi:hypothetical protein N657DRAFT_140450 [Parathielavia appendiculata]|uniref:Uncharacterized protein n=1 Tax=Parathielavia appendiculata TaxID=2587402 RepID=A0AAN6TU93_9PEZI|nr:hypothetical protein N657DRAFT_140450 [Parathielavia appendiculata]